MNAPIATLGCINKEETGANLEDLIDLPGSLFFAFFLRLATENQSSSKIKEEELATEQPLKEETRSILIPPPSYSASPV